MRDDDESRAADVETVPVARWEAGAFVSAADAVAVEAPLSVQVAADGESLGPLVMTMRTPGADPALAAGYLLAEGIISGASDILAVDALGPDAVGVRLRAGVSLDRERLRRGALQSSSCGVCGKVSPEDLVVHGAGPADDDAAVFSPGLLATLPDALRAGQGLFAGTGGVHAVGLADGDGRLLAVAEDVGRHNAFDKLVGAALLGATDVPPLPWRGMVVVLSGRASFELLQKAAATGAPLVLAVGAPSSLAVSLAAARGITLVGFTRPSRFNVYAHPARIVGAGPPTETAP